LLLLDRSKKFFCVIVHRDFIEIDPVYARGADPTGLEVAVATLGFTLLAYADFSGYTDIARGTARMLGFDLVKNFDTPYLSRDMGELWRRWHVSLSSWLRGLPVPGGQPTMAWDEQGRLSQIEQDGWQISYSRYLAQDQLQLPEKLRMQRDSLQVKFIIDGWQTS